MIKGACQVDSIYLDKADIVSGKRAPFFAASVIDLSIEWKSLFKGSIVGELTFEKPLLVFTKDKVERAYRAGIQYLNPNVVSPIRYLINYNLGFITLRVGYELTQLFESEFELLLWTDPFSGAFYSGNQIGKHSKSNRLNAYTTNVATGS